MKKRYIFHVLSLVLVMCVCMSAGNQKKLVIAKVDFEKIKKETQDPHSRYYYPRLMKSFLSNDTVMSIDAYRHLYYGYVFQEDYNPFRESEFGTVVEQLYYKRDLTRAECDTIEKYAELSLADNLFDFDQMKFYIHVLRQKKKYARANVRQFRLDRLVATIMSSGKGTKEDPWVVITPGHEYNMVNFMGYVATNHQELGNGIDYITVEKKKGKSIEGFYFDVSAMMEMAEKKFPE